PINDLGPIFNELVVLPLRLTPFQILLLIINNVDKFRFLHRSLATKELPPVHLHSHLKLSERKKHSLPPSDSNRVYLIMILLQHNLDLFLTMFLKYLNYFVFLNRLLNND